MSMPNRRLDLMARMIATGLGIPLAQGEVLAVLMKEHPRRLTVQEIRIDISSHRPPAKGSLYERISAIRAKLGRGFILSPRQRWRQSAEDVNSYSLSPEALRACRVAIGKAALSLLGEAA